MIFVYLELVGCDLVDLCIVVDSSGSIRDNNPSDGSYDNWKLTLEFVQEVNWGRLKLHSSANNHFVK